MYRQLGLLGVGKTALSKTSVATFGKSVNYLTKKPVDDVAVLKKAVRKVEDDGDEKEAVENVFTAAMSAAERFKSYRLGKTERRRVMIVIVTDERGSDYRKVEDAIVKLRRFGMAFTAWATTRSSAGNGTTSRMSSRTASTATPTRTAARKQPSWRGSRCPFGAARPSTRRN